MPAQPLWSRRCAVRSAARQRPRAAEAEVQAPDKHLRTVVMIVEPPGEPSASSGRPSWRTIVGAICCAGASRRPAAFGPGAAVLARGLEVEVRELVVEQEAPARDGDAAAAGLLDRQGVGDDVAGRVRGDQVRSRRALGIDRRSVGRHGSGRGGAGRARSARVACGHGPGGGALTDAARAAGGVVVGEQRVDRDVDERRVAEVAVAVGVGEPGGLEVTVQGRHRVVGVDEVNLSRMFSTSPTVLPPEDGGPMP